MKTLLALLVSVPVFAAECDTHWKEVRASMLAFKELHFVGTIPGMPAGTMEMTVVERPVDKGPEAFDVKTNTDVKGLPMKLPGLGEHTSPFTKKKFCTELESKETNVTFDHQSPGAFMAEIFRGKPAKREKIQIPAGTFDADFYETNMRTKDGKHSGIVKFWVAKIDGHRMPVRTQVATPDAPVTFDVQLKKAVKR
jgi:hypothetical protein